MENLLFKRHHELETKGRQLVKSYFSKQESLHKTQNKICDLCIKAEELNITLSKFIDAISDGKMNYKTVHCWMTKRKKVLNLLPEEARKEEPTIKERAAISRTLDRKPQTRQEAKVILEEEVSKGPEDLRLENAIKEAVNIHFFLEEASLKDLSREKLIDLHGVVKKIHKRLISTLGKNALPPIPMGVDAIQQAIQ